MNSGKRKFKISGFRLFIWKDLEWKKNAQWIKKNGMEIFK